MADTGELDKSGQGLYTLPMEEPSWLNLKILNLSNNNITEIDTGNLPPTLEYLDMSDNPLRIIKGLFPEGLLYLILTNTNIGKLPVLPDSLSELNIINTPISKKYNIVSKSEITDKEIIEKISGKPYEKYETMLYNDPGKVTSKLPSSINSSDLSNNDEINMSNLGGGARHMGGGPVFTTPLVMVLGHRETNDDIIYQVLTLNEGEKEVMRQYLEPYEPLYGSEAPTIPSPSQGPPHVYFSSSHGEDIFFEKPVPPGCIYITLHECGDLTTLHNYSKIMLAFDDIPRGIKDKLRDPIKYKNELTKEFGYMFHIHYPEAPHPSDRTYLESIRLPFLEWGNVFAKSGVYSIDVDNHFTDNTKKGEERQLHSYNGNFTDNNIMTMYHTSLFPTYNQVKRHIGDRYTLNIYEKMREFKYTQSWLFKHFPGIHYNFSCRALLHHNSENNRMYQRRHKSLDAAEAYINQLPNNAIHSNTVMDMFHRYQDQGIIYMVKKLIDRGIDLNEPSKYTGLRPLQQAVYSLQIGIVKELLKVKGIDKSDTDRLLKNGLKYAISRSGSEEEKQENREAAAEIHRLLHPVRSNKSYAKRKATRRKATRRKTRSRRRFKK